MLNLRTRHLQLVRRRRSLAGYKLNMRGLPDFFAQTPNAVTNNRQGAFAFQARDCHSQTWFNLKSDVVIQGTKRDT